MLVGGQGVDYAWGESGKDTLYGDEEKVEQDGDQGDTDYLYGGDGNDTLYGGPGNDELRGDNFNDTLYGESGNDHLWGGGASDYLYGGKGNDHIYAEDDGTWLYRGPIGLEDTLYIIGGGHVGLALSRVAATLPFRIVVLDNREDLATMAANRWAHQRQVVDYDRIADHVVEGDRSWVVIMTFGHTHDRQVLEGLLGKELAYLGLMGSEAKVLQLFAAMLEDGSPAADLEGVKAPIGVPIGSHTPEEIAISVAAEIIAMRNRS